MILGVAASHSMIHELAEDDVCCPAISSAIIMCATSWSGTAVPSLYVQPIRCVRMSRPWVSPRLRRSWIVSVYSFDMRCCAMSRLRFHGSGAQCSEKFMAEKPMSRSWYSGASDSSNLARMSLPWSACEAVKMVISAILDGMLTMPDFPLKSALFWK